MRVHSTFGTSRRTRRLRGGRPGAVLALSRLRAARTAAVTGVALVVAAMAAGCGGGSAPESAAAARARGADPVPLALGRVEITPVADRFDAGGTLIAPETAVVSSRVLATVRSVAVRAGDRVRRGQTLVTLEAADLDAGVSQARASAAAARASAEAAAADERAAAAALELARATHDRVAALFADRSATAQERDEAVAALRAAESRVAAATAAAQAAREQVAAAESAGRAADVARSWATIAAPFDGLVAARHVDPGSVAAPGAPLVTVESAGALELEVRLDASRAAGLARGQAVDVRVESGGQAGDWRPGRVTEITRVDPAGHSFAATIAFDSTDPAWRSGLFGRARFRGATHDRLTVPADAVVTRGQVAFVYAVDEHGRARLRAVSVGDEDAGRREVLAGLGEGDRVVRRPPPGLEDGAPVTAADAGGRP